MIKLNDKKNKKVINNIEKLIKNNDKSLKKEEKEILISFIDILYTFATESELLNYKAEELLKIASQLFSFINERSLEKEKVRIYNPDIKEHGWESKNTIIELVTKDTPFLVDSITEKLLQHGLSIEVFLHPIIGVERSDKNTIKSLSTFSSKESLDKLTANESVMHIEVSKIWDKTIIENIQKDLIEVLQTVSYAVSDWALILDKMSIVINELPDSVFYLTKKYSSSKKANILEEGDEIKSFLEWLVNNNFIFLGYSKSTIKSKTQAEIVDNSSLGLFRKSKNYIGEDLNIPVIPQEDKKNDSVLFCFKECKHLVNITKTSRKSIVHRPVHMDYISISILDQDGQVVGIHNFLGMFTSVVYHQSIFNIPIIRKKVATVKNSADVPPQGHFSKAMAAVFESFPRDEIFQMPIQQLLDAVLAIVSLEINPRVKLVVRKDSSGRFINTLVFLPRDYLSTELRNNMQRLLSQEFQGTVSNYYTQITDSHLARVQIIIKTQNNQIQDIDIAKVEKKLQDMAYPWRDKLIKEVKTNLGYKDSKGVIEQYQNAFSTSYQNRFLAEEAYTDINYITQSIERKGITFNLYKSPRGRDNILSLKIYSYEEELPLSVFMPILENLGFNVVDEHTYLVEPKVEDSKEVQIWVHRFRLCIESNIDIAKTKNICEEALQQIWKGNVYNDKHNNLILFSQVPWRHVVLIRAYSKFLKQVGFFYDQTYIQNALISHPEISKNIIRLFHIKFIPTIQELKNFITEDGKFSKKFVDSVNNAKSIESIEDALKVEYNLTISHIKKKLYLISNVGEDKVIRTLLEIVEATVRTNFFQKNISNEYKDYISFKFNSKKISVLPDPKPSKEIFVYSTKFEGVHLRGGKVARGGLRWSDRHEDFRTEVLGLMKAQMTKNTVIIPVGSKGGFVIKKNLQNLTRDEINEEGKACYKVFLRGLLDMTDNILGDKIIKPIGVKCYDEDDPYLVVAADKGTATFSDIANSVSKEYSFWLGDAFASGGSVGYDHKKMGITAKGAWISVQQHFYQMGVNIDKETFTAVGIGDMGGDVFGNGMLLSKNLKLIGAFNHIHIFLDPNPDPKISYNERKRLFQMPRSSWQDYNPRLISKGGGVFDRSAKTIKLSKEILEILFQGDEKGLKIYKKTNTITPDDLIKKLLLAPLDLLWNGGIGTYVKSHLESNEGAEDRNNDNVRVNGSDLKVKIVGEGGNLGFTQLGRIEYARNGGRINTDFIDNSAGVDCSDHEVNIKIIFEKLIRDKKIDYKKRDNILEEMTSEVGDLVLKDNWFQTEALCILERQGVSIVEDQERLIKSLEKEEILDRKIEFLPEGEEIKRMQLEGLGFSRPELSVLLSYSKISLYESLLKSDLPDDQYYNNDLLMYFPLKIRERFKGDICNHPLRREIVATIVTNCIINRMGIAAFSHVKEDASMDIDVIARAYTVSRDIFGIHKLWEDIESTRNHVSCEIQMEMFSDVQNLLERSTIWFLKNYKSSIDTKELFDKYSSGVESLYKTMSAILPPVLMEVYKEKLSMYQTAGVEQNLAKKCALLYGMSSACDIIYISKDSKMQLDIVGEVYFKIGARLQLGMLRGSMSKIKTFNYWEKLSVKMLISQLYEIQRQISMNVVSGFCTKEFCSASADEWKGKNRNFLTKYDNFLQDLKLSEYISISKVMMIVKKVTEIFL